MKTYGDAVKGIMVLTHEQWMGKYHDLLLEIVNSQETGEAVAKFSKFVINGLDETDELSPVSQARQAQLLLEIALRSAYCQGLLIGMEMEKQDISTKTLLSL